MPTAIKMWEVAGKELRTLQDATLADSHVEAELETWLVANPSTPCSKCKQSIAGSASVIPKTLSASSRNSVNSIEPPP